MKLGLSSLLFVRSTIEEAIQTCKKLGAECVEIIYDIPHFSPGYDRRRLLKIKELLGSYGLDVSVHASFWDLNPASHHPELWKLSLKQIKRSIAACRLLGGEITVVHFGKCPTPDAEDFLRGTKQRYRKFVDECLRYAQDHGVTVGLENAGRDPRSYPSGVEELKKFLSEVDGAKMTFDIGHAHLEARRAGQKNTGRTIANQIKEMREYLVHVHIHDNMGKTDDHLIPGDGEINFDPIIRALKEINYNGLIIAEFWNPHRARETARRGLKTLKALVGVT
ncbi:MAG: hypothetical protein DRN83_00935 [Hadesarchaea archaeon]|nr:MAG: hypothetical protein DRN83_00935 [Hadesarchaea archaeon]HDI12822.1 sugar phosphate isomerase/epimerase [Hadesarchaea archaeon]